MWPSINNSSGAPSSSGQWSFNPAVYQNIPYEQVDWASLAQQWIKMKETMPSINQGPLPPPAPQISSKSLSSTSTPTVVENQNDIEGGEAPMDMDTKDDETPSGPVGVASDDNWNQWRNWQSQWGWGWPGNAGTVPLADSSQSTPSTVDRKGYWSDNLSVGSDKAVPEAWMKGNKLNNRHPQKPVPADQLSVIAIGRERKKKKKKKQRVPKHSTSTKHCLCRYKLKKDAAKKKQLPAWIREGLNKMEREKQKKLERDRMMQEKLMRDQLKSEELLQEISEENIPSFKMPISNEEHGRNSPPLPSINARYHQKKFSSSSAVEHARQRPPRNYKEDSSSIRKTKDQIMEESMLKVRRILTEILLESTESLVHVIAKEEYRRAKSTASAQQIRKSNALSSLTGNLGLSVYESESESSTSDRERDDRRGDSDEELKMVIDRKRKEFQRIEDLIEQEIEDQEAKERLIARKEYDSDNNNDDNDNKEEVISRTNNEPVHYYQEPIKNTKITAERIAPSYHGNFNEIHHRDEIRLSAYQKSNSHGEKVNGNKVEKSKPRNTEKMKKKSSSSSLSSKSVSSSSSTSSEPTSSDSSSSSSSDSSDAESERSTNDGRPSRKKKRKHKSKTKEKTGTESKGKRYRSRSRSTSRSRYSRSDTYSSFRNHKSDSSDRRRTSPFRRRSPSYRRRSPSYHRESREMSRSRYRESSRRRDSDSKRRRRSSSTESRHSRYKRH